jgi:type VI secretion system VasD/TssJ family lipoprotein
MYYVLPKFMVKIARIALMALVAGCASHAKEINALVISSGQLNPSVDQRSSPVVLEVFQLKELRDFQSADYFKLADMNKSESKDVLSNDRFIIQPSQVVRFDLPLNIESKHIGLFAAFHHLDDLRWRSTVDIGKVSSFELPVLGEVYGQKLLLCIELGDSGVSTRWLSGQNEMNHLQKQARDSAEGKIPFSGCGSASGGKG